MLTLLTFGIAIFTPPLSGPYCPSGCFTYPFSDIMSRFPRDYVWMYPAILLVISYYVLMVAIHYVTPKSKKILSHIGISFALMATVIFVTDYFLQISVIQPSLLNDETDGIALLTQFNAHGIFIALEEIGFFMMSLSMLFMAPIFSGKERVGKAIRWSFVICFVVTILAFILYSIFYGIFREYRFEVAAISINWMTLIISGILLAIMFRRNKPTI
jgi:hypothetical protein